MTFKLTNHSGDKFESRVPPPEIYEQGACRDQPSEIFFGEEATETHYRMKRIRSTAKTRQARLICATCPVIEVCQTYSLKAAEPYGVWGGLDPWDRAYLINRRGSVNHPTPPGSPVRRREVPCDNSKCGGIVMLGRALTQLSSTGGRYCYDCLKKVEPLTAHLARRGQPSS